MRSSGHRSRTVALALAAVAVAAGLVAAGRFSAGAGSARSDGFQAGHQAGYTEGVHDGRNAGVQEGRALQAPLNLPSDAQDAARAQFNAGYVAGANDVFDGYDGGWGLDTPYVVVLSPAGNGVTYRIQSRVTLQPDVNYHLCPHSATTLCQEPR